MSWQITQEGSCQVLTLEGELGIQDAVDFYQAVLPLTGFAGPTHLHAGGVTAMHTAILQILYALSKAITEFQVTEKSPEFQAAETRVGLFISSPNNTEPQSRA